MGGRDQTICTDELEGEVGEFKIVKVVAFFFYHIPCDDLLNMTSSLLILSLKH